MLSVWMAKVVELECDGGGYQYYYDYYFHYYF